MLNDYIKMLKLANLKNAALERERDEFKDKSGTLDNQLCELYHAMELISKIATVVPRDTAILEVINCYRTGELLKAHSLEQQAIACFECINGVEIHNIQGEAFVRMRDVNNFGVRKQLEAEALSEQGK